MSKKLVIFDLDGTLLDTSEDLMDSMNGMLDFYGYPNITLDQAKCYIGNGAKKFVYRSLPEDKKDMVDEALIKYNEIYNASGSPKTHLYEGIDEVLKTVKSSGAVLAIVSNKPQPSTDEVYGRYLKDFGFDFVYGNRPGFNHKPDRECGEYVLNKFGVKAEDAVVIGDGETDVRFALNLGSSCIAVTWGFRSREVLAREGAEVFAENPFKLNELLIKFLSI